MKNIGYHTRLYRDPATKVVGGSFGGSLDIDTANRLVKAHFTVVVKPSGMPVFVDREGREVFLYFSVDARETELGKKVLAEWRKERAAQEEIRQAQEALEAEVIANLMEGLSHAEIVSRLSRPVEAES